MAVNFNVTDRIGDIVVEFPGASSVLKQYRIDFCCGGDRPLETAIKEGNLDENKILNELNAKYKEFEKRNEEYTDWAKERPGKLMEYIIGKHHKYLKQELPELSELLFKILRVHGIRHEELFHIHKLFNNLRTELEEHLVKEEEYLFPLIQNYEALKNDSNREKVLKLVEELEKEHTGAGDIIKELREAADHYSIPEDACKTFEVTYIKLGELESDLFEHIHLENNILFKNI